MHTSWQKKGSTKNIFTPANLTYTAEESSEMLQWEYSFYVAERWTIQKVGDRYL